MCSGWFRSAFKWLGARDAEVVIVDNGSNDGTDEWLEEEATDNDRLRVIHVDHPLGEGSAKRILPQAVRWQNGGHAGYQR